MPIKTPLPVRDEQGQVVAYYRIDDAHAISLLDNSRQLQTGCQMGPDHPCRSGLHPAD